MVSYSLGGVLDFLGDVIEIVPSVIGPEAGVEGGGDVAQRRRTTGEVGLL